MSGYLSNFLVITLEFLTLLFGFYTIKNTQVLYLLTISLLKQFKLQKTIQKMADFRSGA